MAKLSGFENMTFLTEFWDLKFRLTNLTLATNKKTREKLKNLRISKFWSAIKSSNAI